MTSSHLQVALVGNPNVGKTALVNSVAGSRLKVGNWPGVTIEKKEVTYKWQDTTIKLVDLPGIYSLQTQSIEEKITSKYLQKQPIDLIVNVIDSTNLKRSLYLTSELLSLGIPIICVFNYWTKFQKLGGQIDLQTFCEKCQITAISLEANKAVSKAKLSNIIIKTALTPLKPLQSKHQSPPFTDWKSGKVSRSQDAHKRHNWVEKIIAEHAKLPGHTMKDWTDKIDEIALHPVWGLVTLTIILYLIFKIPFDASDPFINWVDTFFQFIANWLGLLLQNIQTPLWLQSFILDGVLAGVGTVLTFIPLLFFLYLLLAILEESGYISRIAYLFDRLLKPFGLQGRAFIPLLIGLGCNVPGVYATRTLAHGHERRLTATIISFVSCGAKLPIYSLFTAAFFLKNQALVVLGLYLLGIFTALLWASILQRTTYQGHYSPLLLELPPYRLPTFMMLYNGVSHKIKQFITQAGTLITAVIIMIWALVNLPFGAPIEKSVLGQVSKAATPIFQPLGFGDSWQATAAIIPGFLAKEAVVGGLATLYNIQETEETQLESFNDDLLKQGQSLIKASWQSVKSIFASLLPGILNLEDSPDTRLQNAIKKDLSPAAALSFMVFNLLLMSCVAVMGAMKQEFGAKFMLKTLAMTISTAYLASLLTYQIGRHFL